MATRRTAASADCLKATGFPSKEIHHFFSSHPHLHPEEGVEECARIGNIGHSCLFNALPRHLDGTKSTSFNLLVLLEYRDGQPTVDVALIGNVQHVVDVSHNVRREVGKGVRVVEHDGDGDLRCRVRCPWIHSLPPTTVVVVPFNCDVVFSLVGVELCLELFPNMAITLRLLLQGKDTT